MVVEIKADSLKSIDDRTVKTEEIRGVHVEYIEPVGEGEAGPEYWSMNPENGPCLSVWQANKNYPYDIENSLEGIREFAYKVV